MITTLPPLTLPNFDPSGQAIFTRRTASLDMFERRMERKDGEEERRETRIERKTFVLAIEYSTQHIQHTVYSIQHTAHT